MSKVIVVVIGYQVGKAIEIRENIFKLLCFGESKIFFLKELKCIL